MVISGAEIVVGFDDTTMVADCNRFALDMTDKLINDCLSVEEAINSINDISYIKNMADIAVIAGNGSNQLR